MIGQLVSWVRSNTVSHQIPMPGSNSLGGHVASSFTIVTMPCSCVVTWQCVGVDVHQGTTTLIGVTTEVAMPALASIPEPGSAALMMGAVAILLPHLRQES